VDASRKIRLDKVILGYEIKEDDSINSLELEERAKRQKWHDELLASEGSFD